MDYRLIRLWLTFFWILLKKLFSQTRKPSIYFKYVDDTFAIFDNKAEAEADELVNKHNCLIHLSNLLLKKKVNVYRFLMSMSKEQDSGFKTGVY